MPLLLSVLFLMVSVDIFGGVDCKTHNLFLNSYRNCSRTDLFDVSVDKDYIIKPDVSPDTASHTFRECEMTFYSAREDGHICLLEMGKTGSIQDTNAIFEAREGVGNPDDPEIDKLTPFINDWAFKEYCSKGQYITLYLKKMSPKRSANIRKIFIEFTVVDIESKKRILFLDGDYCSRDCLLLNSTVTIWNRPQFPGMAVTTLNIDCGIEIKKVNNITSKSICFAYIPSGKVNCDSHWEFAISTAFYSLEDKYKVYRLMCNESRANKIHVFCAEPTRHVVTAILMRNDSILSNSSIESSDMFRYIVMDYEGSEESLLEIMKDLYGDSGGFELGFVGKMVIISLSVVVILLILAFVMVYCKRRRYKLVDRENNSKAI